MPNPSMLLEQIADLTSIRDVELLELSLLKTVDQFVSPVRLSLYKLDGAGELISAMRCHNNHCAIDKTINKLPPAYLSAFDQLSADNSVSYKSWYEGGLLYAYDLFDSPVCRVYLVLHVSQELKGASKELMEGMLQVFRNFCALLEDSQRDALTGLPNRMTFDNQLNRLIGLVPSQDSESGYWVAMIDIDHFKRVNDDYGHLYGDEVLVLLSRLLEQQLSTTDRLFRFGGEEFVLLVEAASVHDAETIFERLRRSVSDHMFPQVGQVTISVGVVRITLGVFPITLLDYADQALYHSKNEGRNRVTYFSELVEKGKAIQESIDGGSIDLF